MAPMAEEAVYVDTTTSYCYEKLIADTSCCRDRQKAADVLSMDVYRPGTSWRCVPPRHGGECLDAQAGERGADMLWWPAGAGCASPRILYVHGGHWKFHGPAGGSYDVLASKLAKAAKAVVLVPDYRLVPVGNYSDMLQSLLMAWRWLGMHGPQGLNCGSEPRASLFVGGDSSGGGTGLSFFLRLHAMKEGPVERAPSGYFGFSPWTNLECTTPSYYSNSFAAFKDGGTTAYIGDIFNRESPQNNTAALQKIARAYLGGVGELLEDPVASPFFATEKLLRNLPPMYFAVSGTEIMAGDSMVVAGLAARQGVLVAQDVFPGMWHAFPLYSEGCGSGVELWQGRVVLEHTGDFVRLVDTLARDHPEMISRPVPGVNAPKTNIHFPHLPWIAIMPLSFEVSSPPAPPPQAAEAPAPGAAAAGPGEEPPSGRDAGGCGVETLAGAFLTGAAGGLMLISFALASAWLYFGRHAPAKEQEAPASATEQPIRYEVVSLSPSQPSIGPDHGHGPDRSFGPDRSYGQASMTASTEHEGVPRWSPSRYGNNQAEAPHAAGDSWPWPDALGGHPRPPANGAPPRRPQEAEARGGKPPIMRDMRAPEVSPRHDRALSGSYMSLPYSDSHASGGGSTSPQRTVQVPIY